MRNRILIEKMVGYTAKILAYCHGHSYADFSRDTMLVEACVFNLSQLGELCRRVDDAFTAAHPQIPWHAIYGLRNHIVHDYEGVNLTLVWEIIQEDLPTLQTQLQQLLH